MEARLTIDAGRQAKPKVPKHQPGDNPATWVLTTTSLGMMQKLGTNFAIAYAKSGLNRFVP